MLYIYIYISYIFGEARCHCRQAASEEAAQGQMLAGDGKESSHLFQTLDCDFQVVPLGAPDIAKAARGHFRAHVKLFWANLPGLLHLHQLHLALFQEPLVQFRVQLGHLDPPPQPAHCHSNKHHDNDDAKQNANDNACCKGGKQWRNRGQTQGRCYTYGV